MIARTDAATTPRESEAHSQRPWMLRGMEMLRCRAEVVVSGTATRRCRMQRVGSGDLCHLHVRIETAYAPVECGCPDDAAVLDFWGCPACRRIVGWCRDEPLQPLCCGSPAQRVYWRHDGRCRHDAERIG